MNRRLHKKKKKSNKTEIFSYRYCHQGWSQWWSRSICCTDGGQTRSDVFSKHMTPCAAVNPCTTLADVSGHTQRSPYGNNIYVYTHTHTMKTTIFLLYNNEKNKFNDEDYSDNILGTCCTALWVSRSVANIQWRFGGGDIIFNFAEKC